MSLQPPPAPLWTRPQGDEVPGPTGQSPVTQKRRGCAGRLGVMVGIVGPIFALFTLMGGAVEPLILITVGSGGLAGLLVAAEFGGIRGAIGLLILPAGWAVTLSGMVFAMAGQQARETGERAGSGEIAETLAFIAAFTLILGVSMEVGYAIGRLVARRLPKPNPEPDPYGSAAGTGPARG